MTPRILIVLALFTQNVYALKCSKDNDSIEEHVNRASAIFVAEIISATTDSKAKPARYSAEYRLIETIKGKPQSVGKLSSQQTMDGMVFSEGLHYIVFLYDNNYVGFCGGSAQLNTDNAPHKSNAYLDKIRTLVLEKNQKVLDGH